MPSAVSKGLSWYSARGGRGPWAAASVPPAARRAGDKQTIEVLHIGRVAVERGPPMVWEPTRETQAFPEQGGPEPYGTLASRVVRGARP